MEYHIAVVDDDTLALTSIRMLLLGKGMKVSCLRSAKDMLKYMEKHTPDLILLDVLMPEIDGFEAFNRLRYLEDRLGRKRTPVIFLTGENDAETEQRGLRLGASDFIHKPLNDDIVIRRIINSIENQKTIDSLTEEATIDKLTGFYNKASGTDRISEQILLSAGALMMIDLDNFKLVNDLFGHDMGDKVLETFADIVRSNTRDTDIVSRVGGDEFLGWFPDLKAERAVASLTRRLNDQLVEAAARLMGEDNGIPLGISIGVVFAGDGDMDFRVLFDKADGAMYLAKKNGKHGYAIYDLEFSDNDNGEDMDAELSRVIQIISERSEGKGAMLLGQEAFACNYRYIERFLVRYGGVATRLLFSLSSNDQDDNFSDLVSQFGEVLQNTLRKSDIIFQWKQTRYFVVLPQLEEADVNKVIDRIMKAWEKTGQQDSISIKYVSSILRKEHYESEE